MNDDINDHIEVCTQEFVSSSENVHVVINETIQGRDTICAISEQEDSTEDFKTGKLNYADIPFIVM